jgi:growth hormone secretagogue receptor
MANVEATTSSAEGSEGGGTSLSVPAAPFWEEDVGWKIDLYYTPICVGCGVCTNLIAFCVLCRPYWRRCSTGIYMAVISIFDSVILLYALTFWLSRHFDFRMLTENSCKPVNFVFYFSLHFDVMTLLAMTAERLVAVRFPMKASSLCTVKNARIALCTLAVAAMGLNLHFFWTYGWIDGDCKSYPQHLSFTQYVYPWVDSSVYSFIPTVSLAVFNIFIISSVSKSDKALQDQTASQQKRSTQHITLMLLVITSAFLVLTGPLTILNVVKTVWRANERPGTHDYAVYVLTRRIMVALMYSNHAINFWLYCLSGSRFRSELRAFLNSVCCCRRTEVTISKPTTSCE